ncbi:hypothetical protein BX070DRAFT_232275 [Coemansia spiralis]|nr:hypothetical protein BX070DRAFT_232275 [Coemansia spiralis]
MSLSHAFCSKQRMTKQLRRMAKIPPLSLPFPVSDSMAFALTSDRPITINTSLQADARNGYAQPSTLHFFENKSSQQEFMPSAVLKETLYRALEEFPILTGHIYDTGGISRAILVEEGNLNTPTITESTSDVHFSALKKARFHWNAWPKDIATAGPVTTPEKDGTIKLVTVHIVRLKGDSGIILFCSIPHYVLDGFGYYKFLSRWATLCRESCNNRPHDTASPEPPKIYVSDRALVDRCLEGRRRPLDIISKSVFENSGFIANTFARLPYKLQTRLTSAALNLNYGNAYYFHVSSEALNRLHDMFSAHTDAESTSSSPSSYALLTALFSLSITQAMFPKGNSSCMVLNCIHVHNLLDFGDSSYIGNPMFAQPLFVSNKQLKPGDPELDFVEAARQIDEAINGIDISLMGEFCSTLEENPGAYASLALRVVIGEPMLTVIDERAYKAYSVDFGHGGPTWVSGLPWNMANFVAYFASSENLDGTVVYQR